MSEGPVATLRWDDDGFLGAHLTFPYDAVAPDGLRLAGRSFRSKPLREAVADLPGASWRRSAKTWVVPDVTDIPPGWLTKAGFRVVCEDGTPAKRSDLVGRLGQDRSPGYLAQPAATGVPDWFGLELWPYQVQGAMAVAAGKRLLADAPGVGKTRQALAAAAILGARRTLVLCPPVVLSHWEREAAASGLAGISPGECSRAGVGKPGGRASDLVPPEPQEPQMPPGFPPSLPEQGSVVVLRAGKRMPAPPPAGVVIASAALVAGRPELAAALAKWHPDVFILDEAHSAKSWGSRRSRVMRRLARSCGVTIPTTGTPMLASPLELAALLDLTGDLEPLFGSYLDYRRRVATKGKWGWRAKKDALAPLRSIVDQSVWVRRTKDDVLSDMPPKTRAALWVDVPLGEYEAATAEINQEIDEWLDSFGRGSVDQPTSDEVAEWCASNVGMVSRLRRAAGMAKVEAAVELIEERLVDQPGRPLVVWAHHKVVVAALAEAVGQRWRAEIVDGSVPEQARSALVDRFQAGEIDVLVCSIQAAGVGVTLTRASEAIFVESDWTPALVAQAEDRIHRIGQTRSVTYTTLVAAGTLDEHIQTVLARKARTLDAMMDGDHSVGVVTPRKLASDVLADMVGARVRARRRSLRPAA